MVEIPVEIATFQNHQFHSLVRIFDHLVTITVTTPISTEVIFAVIKILVTTTRVTANLVTAMLKYQYWFVKKYSVYLNYISYEIFFQCILFEEGVKLLRLSTCEQNSARK